MLAVGARFPPYHHAGIVIDRCAVAIHALAVALHLQLLQIGGETVQILVVGQHCVGGGAKEVAIPDAQHAHQYRHVLLQRRTPEVLIHRVRAGQ